MNVDGVFTIHKWTFNNIGITRLDSCSNRNPNFAVDLAMSC